MTYAEMKNLLQSVDDGVMRLEVLMDFGRQMAPIPDDATCSEITGCASRVQICRHGNRFYGDADSAIVRGIVALIVAMVDNHSPEQIKNIDILGEIAGLNLGLGAGRMNGINSMVRFLHNL